MVSGALAEFERDLIRERIQTGLTSARVRGHGDTDLAGIAAPTLVIVGDADVVSTPHARRIAKWLTNGSLAVITGGHFTPVSQARQVNELITQFLGAGTPDGDA